MIGLQYLHRISQMIQGIGTGGAWMDKKATFDFLYQAAKEYAIKSHCLKSIQNISVVTDKPITGISAAYPSLVTCVGHGLVTGDHVMLKNITGTTELNDRRFIITRFTDDTFTLNGIDSTNLTAYVSGGDTYQMSYLLNYDFAGIRSIDPDTGLPYLRFSFGGQDSIVNQIDMDQTDTNYEDDPTINLEGFSIVSRPPSTPITAVTTSAGPHAGGESCLTDLAADFSKIEPGDEVVNKTNKSSGVVLGRLSSTVLSTSLFNFSVQGDLVSSYSSWGLGDTYLIIPGQRYQLVLSAPIDADYATIAIPYFQLPDPVYSDYGKYILHHPYVDEALLNYVAWMYEFKEGVANVNSPYYQNWLRLSRDAIAEDSVTTFKTYKKVNRYI